jgi:hypothetical protein
MSQMFFTHMVPMARRAHFATGMSAMKYIKTKNEKEIKIQETGNQEFENNLHKQKWRVPLTRRPNFLF